MLQLVLSNYTVDLNVTEKTGVNVFLATAAQGLVESVWILKTRRPEEIDWAACN